MVLLKAKNPNITDLERTELAAAPAAAAVSITVDDTEGFAANDFVVIGTLGAEKTEAVRITAITSDTVLAVTALSFAHNIDEPVQKTLYDQIRFYSNADSFASAINTSDVDWANPNQQTHYNHTSGSSSTTYKYDFYNSNSTVASDKSATFSVPTYYCTVADVADFLNLNISQEGEIKTHQVIKLINRATEEVDSMTNTAFSTQTIATGSDEYHDGKKKFDNVYFTKNKPIITLTRLQTTLSDESVGPTNATWTTITEDEDFTVDKNTGALTIANENSLPTVGDNRLRVAYTWGYATVPDDIRHLTVLLVSKMLSVSGVGRNILSGRTGADAVNATVLDSQINSIVARYRFGGIENT